MRRASLIVMVKEPVAGRVKTRLGREIGMPAAAWWFRHQSLDLLRRLTDPRWQLVLAVSPGRAVVSRVWPPQLPRMAQGRGDLGARMARALGRQTGPVVLIGGDVPGIRRQHIARAFRALGNHASVIGPATDGGFWLVGLRHSSQAKGLFAGAEWSTSRTLEMTIPTLPAPVAQIDTLSDVDTVDDLAAWNALRKQRDGLGPA